MSSPMDTSAPANQESVQPSSNTVTTDSFADTDMHELEQIIEQVRDGHLTKSQAKQSIMA